MADKKISDLTAITTLADGDLFELENAGGNSRKVTFANTKASIGGHVLISKQTPTGTATVTFSSIPATYTHLYLAISGRSAGATTVDNVNLTFNSDTGANYDTQFTQTSGTSVTANDVRGGTSATITLIAGSTATANFLGSGNVFINNYTDTNLDKNGTYQTGAQNSTAAGGVTTRAGWFGWRSTSAITQIDLVAQTGNYVAGSVISLYGVY